MKDIITFSIENDFCPVANALKVIEGKWKLPILWVLSKNGTLRYNELKKGVSGITNMMLTSSLKELEQSGLVNRVQYNEIPPRVDYSLSKSGQNLLPVLDELARWGEGLIKRSEIEETERLKLVPLQSKHLALSLEDYGKMQSDLGLRISKTILDEGMQYAMKVRLRKVLEDTQNYLWLTNWAIVHKEENVIIGFIMIKGYPNENGEVIVGYGIDEDKYRRNGYATEALKGLTKWIFENPKAMCIIADTEKTNIPSHKVLQKVGAVKYKETDELVWWKIEKNVV